MTDENSIVIKKINIDNFKCFNGNFSVDFNKDINVLVGDNEAGKSTVLEAIHLALTGVFQGRYIKNEISQYLFNYKVVEAYLQSVKLKSVIELPYILIELFIEGTGVTVAELSGNGNRDKIDATGISVKICFDERNRGEYEELIKRDEISTLPIEYYHIIWESFARQPVTPRTIPIKSALIDSSSSRSVNGSDLYISRIIRDNLDTKEIVDVSQAHRKMRESFMCDESIVALNAKIGESANIIDKKIRLAVDLSAKNGWENTLITNVNDIPFHFAGKGEQNIIKTKLALGHKKSVEANVLILEEPESHLSHSNLNKLLYDIEKCNSDKQVIISTHSSFVANKLGLDKLILINGGSTTRIIDLDDDTEDFFTKIAGYDTLRMVLCKKAILVEGDSDELVVQKAYMSKNSGRLPIHDGIDIISVGTSFLRFLDIAKKLDNQVAVVTDNDGCPEDVRKKYSDYYGENGNVFDNISICFDDEVDSGDLLIKGAKYNYNTLEPKMLKSNGLKNMNNILNTKYKTEDDLRIHMRCSKTDVALKIFNYSGDIIFPQYILDAIE